jgi:hypothetical protein
MTGFSADSAATALALLLLGLLVPQVVLTLWFTAMVRRRTAAFRRRDGSRVVAAETPADVVLCLRGCDPTLEQVIESLGRQQHDDWRLRLIVDAVDDPAWDVAHAAVARIDAAGGASWRECTIEPLAERPQTGSLKCASLRQAIGSLDDRTQVVALIDADSIVHERWLVSLVDACLQPGVGAVSGNRWYVPERDSLSGTVRAIWNAGAIVQMSAFGIPWGGSLAIRREAVADSGWLEIIRTTLCEDTALAAPLARAGWKYEFVPALVAVDEDDDIALTPLTRWISRQLLTARLHHPGWPLVAVHGVTTSVALVAAVAACVLAATSGRWQPLAVIAAALGVYEAGSMLLLLIIDRSVLAAVAAMGTRFRPLDGRRTAWWCAMLPVTQCVYAAATLGALRARVIEWRGIFYEIRRPRDRYEVWVRQ